MFKNNLAVTILHNGFSDMTHPGLKEDIQDTLDTVEYLYKALVVRGYVVRKCEITVKNIGRLLDIPGDIYFNLIEDYGWSLCHRVLKILEEANRHVIGADLAGLLLTDNKVMTKKRMVAYGLPIAEFQIFKTGREKLKAKMKFPLIVKPAREHAGIGISQASVVENEKELRERLRLVLDKYPGEAIVERYIDGREIHATVIGNGNKLDVMPLAEIGYVGKFVDRWKVYSYEAKWVEDSWEYKDAPVYSPADLSPELNEKIVKLSKELFKIFECRDYVRFDMRVDDKGKIYILDINMNPSLKYHELDATWMSAQARGWSYEDLVERVILISKKRHLSVNERVYEKGGFLQATL